MNLVARTENLVVAYGGRRVLDGISLDVRAGELLAVIGPNAAGKTTLLRALASVIVPNGGRVDRLVAAHEVAYLAQTGSLPGDWTALDVVGLGRLPHVGPFGRARDADARAVSEALRRTRTLDLAHRRISALSGGQRQRVALARVLAQEPRLLLLDEPTAHLDLRHQLETLAVLRTEARRGVAAVAVVHDLGLAADVDRCAVLSDGRLAAFGTPREVLRHDLINAVFGARVNVFSGRNGRIVVVPALGAFDPDENQERECNPIASC